ncbi:hypothetical protein [Streptomyces sp. NBC_00658]|uniref:hypothetical protein n=1 Tax=Streptomyces sp. NBC_00658 TaxID=2975800 RepID=UPI00324AE61A
MPLTRRLSTHGISVRPAKNTEVLALAVELPASILSDVLGMHIVTAVDWVKYVKRDWTGYIEAKAADRHKGLVQVWVTGSVTRPGGPMWS